MKTVNLNIIEAVQVAKQGRWINRRGRGEHQAWTYNPEKRMFETKDGKTFSEFPVYLIEDTDYEVVPLPSEFMNFGEAWQAAKQGKIVKNYGGIVHMCQTKDGKMVMFCQFKNMSRRVANMTQSDISSQEWVTVNNLNSKEWTIVSDMDEEFPKTLDDIKCDRCGKPAEFNEGGGVCDSCEKTLCHDCGQWTSEEDDERCEQCRREAEIAFSRCPRCNRINIRLIDKYPSRSGDVHNRWKIVCNYCGIEKDGFSSKQEAIDWWNTGEPYKAED